MIDNPYVGMTNILVWVLVIVGFISIIFWMVAGTNWSHTARDMASSRELLEKILAELQGRSAGPPNTL